MRSILPGKKRAYLSATCTSAEDRKIYEAMKHRAELTGTSLARMVLEACREYLRIH